jgi:HlyD family secretion protein
MRTSTAKKGAFGLLTFLTVGGLALAVSACGEGEASEAPSLQTAEVLRQNMRITAEATGQVEPVRSVEVKSKASGEVLRLYADVGDRVGPGALLAEIEPRDVQNSYNQAKADLEVAQARVDIARAQLERSRDLLEAGVITQQEFESTNLEYANAQASLVKAETNLELAELRLQDVTIRAPVAGTILQRNVEEGTVIQSASSNVSGGTTLFVMANLDDMQVRTLVDETDMGEIKAGLPATVEVEAYPGRTFEGVVQKVEPQAVVQQNVTMFPVIVYLENRSGLLKPGMNAEVETLLVEQENALVVPNASVVLPNEMAPAASVLGMDPEITLDRSVYRELMAQVDRGAAGAGPEAGSGAESEASAGASPSGRSPGAGRARLDSLRARVERGEISQDSLDALRASLRSRMAGGAGAVGQGMTMETENPALSGLINTRGQPRPAVTFVLRPDSTLEMRPVLMGVNDWDNTEILAGLEEGEQVALIGAAQLMAEQQEFMNRIRSRAGGMFGGPGRR